MITGRSAQELATRSTDQEKGDYLESMRRQRVLMTIADSLLRKDILSPKEYASFAKEISEMTGLPAADKH